MINDRELVCGGHAYICNMCERELEGYEITLHWKKENFTLCGDCIKKLALDYIFTDLKINENVVVNRKVISEKLRNKVFIKFGNKCVSCGSYNNLEIDHIVPFSLGGKTEFKNLQLLCKKCNLKKGKRQYAKR